MKRISRVGESFGTGKVKNVKVEKLDSVDKKIGGYTNVVQKMKLFMKRILKNGKEDSMYTNLELRYVIYRSLSRKSRFVRNQDQSGDSENIDFQKS
ncbi:hypothetical protein B9Z55_002996 [Caenorhabditis nigoni]|uniref:Uncharacterized protein n=1 Tax=Caenorhabditis nigoni TaxID=1611254 RepID=A0A2G5VNH8_9PELO|nr:hypothetical protein B9Z55_002996 [Caenorhabditis nigoni]